LFLRFVEGEAEDLAETSFNLAVQKQKQNQRGRERDNGRAGPRSEGVTSEGVTSEGVTSKGVTSEGVTSEGGTSEGGTSEGGMSSRRDAGFGGHNAKNRSAKAGTLRAKELGDVYCASHCGEEGGGGGERGGKRRGSVFGQQGKDEL